MRNAKDLLERAERQAPAPTFTFDDLERARTRHERRKRIGTVAFALVLAAVAFGSAFLALRQPGGSVVGSSGPAAVLPPATEAPLVAAPGQYYYRAVLLLQEFDAGAQGTIRLDASFWWSSSDESGRIEVDDRANYGIDEGRFEAGDFPNGNAIDVSDFPLGTAELTMFLLERSSEIGVSPAPMVTPPPEGAPNDGQLWRAITDLLQDPHVTPSVRAALLDVAASLQGSHTETDATDPFGRPAHIITFGNWGGEVPERLYVDPATHELLAWTATSNVGDGFRVFVVQDAGAVDSTEVAAEPKGRSVPLTLLSAEDLVDVFAR